MELQNIVEAEQYIFEEKALLKRCNGFYNRCVKRIIDFVLALFLAVVLSPFYLILSVVIIAESGFPVFYRASRGGYQDKPFRIFKFRSMVKDADKIGGGTTSLNDSRITKVGTFLRKTKLDEIPQLFNILNGTMSFIGPRPELLKYTDAYDSTEKYILKVRPGITDYSSLKFINLDEIVGTENADEMYEKYVLKTKNNLRLLYVSKVSFRTDFSLFMTTVWKVIRKALKVIFVRKPHQTSEEVENEWSTLS